MEIIRKGKGIVLTELEVTQLLQQLRLKEVNKINVSKEDFLTFRSFLVKQDDFKQFRGIAQQGGHVQYTYLDEPRS
ncbi:hypothetical protein Q75_05075 [Bacillus coahuilensis p1.1.43]|uniref:Abortive phage infection protein n=1 Tax=Bacillus coahuilensis p1.1.43 TaxID=1150625 RepID=A0A147KAC3_9BACI|nr:hypothetical protein Q75_05075 [Bacillus coahuilensis p1.1.43]